LAVIAGFLYDQVYVPSRPVARVGNQSLARSAYWEEKRHQTAATVSQSLFLTTFGAQFAQQVLSQIGSVNTSLATIKADPVDTSVVDAWVDRQIVKQGASNMSIQVSEADIAQLINANYGPGFGPTTETTSTMSLTPVTLEPEATAAVTATVATTPEAPGVAATPQATVITATNGVTPTATLAPTEVPTVTPQNEEAAQRVDAIYNKLYDTYVQQLAQVDPTLKPRLTVEDFRAGLHDQFERQALALKVQEQLVPDASFTPTSEPSNIEARHILVKVTVPISATDQERDAAFEARRPAAEALLARVRGGESFEAVAQEASDDYATRADGGMLPGFKPNGETIDGTQLDPAIVDAVAKLDENQISDLVRTPFGWHI
ncbi:MAG TPA: peptidylprolyl isomerase, partial [Roseiflexaceae bacterium]|nr:peptidylprolyl isomerase [Roseiflexaceae bacterium]